MINVSTFQEMLKSCNDLDFVLKVIQADVILSKSRPKKRDYTTKDGFLNRLIEKHSHNDIEKKHYDAAIRLYTYQAIKDLGGLGGSGKNEISEFL